MSVNTTYGESLARRILSGAGALNLVPYRAYPHMTVPVLAHGVDNRGRFLVTCPAGPVDYLGGTEVRVDAVKKALEFNVDITVASLHALGRVRWAGDEECASTLGVVPAPQHRVGVVELEKIILHGPHGVTKCDAAELLAGVRGSEIVDRELDAREQIARLSGNQLSTLLSGALVGMAPGHLLSEMKVHSCTPMGEHLWVVDIDSTGVVLVKKVDGRITTVLVTFPEPVDTIADLAGAVESLATHTSVRHASPRI